MRKATSKKCKLLVYGVSFSLWHSLLYTSDVRHTHQSRVKYLLPSNFQHVTSHTFYVPSLISQGTHAAA